MNEFQEIHYDPGIFGFVKAHRHQHGPAIVLSTWEDEDTDWAAVYWVKRLHHAASPIDVNLISLTNTKSMKAVERIYELHMQLGPPSRAYREDPDFQRQRVYDWEDDNVFPGTDPLSFDECKSFLTQVWKRIGTGPEPTLSINKRFIRPMAFMGRIILPEVDPEYYRRKPVILHEITHQLEFDDKHGPLFVRQYIDLCVRFLRMDRDHLTDSARRYKISF